MLCFIGLVLNALQVSQHRSSKHKQAHTLTNLHVACLKSTTCTQNNHPQKHTYKRIHTPADTHIHTHTHAHQQGHALAHTTSTHPKHIHTCTSSSSYTRQHSTQKKITVIAQIAQIHAHKYEGNANEHTTRARRQTDRQTQTDRHTQARLLTLGSAAHQT
jgi:hypothetical protein